MVFCESFIIPLLCGLSNIFHNKIVFQANFEADLKRAITYFAPKLREHFRKQPGNANLRDSDINLRHASGRYGQVRLVKEFQKQMADLAKCFADSEADDLAQACVKDLEEEEAAAACLEDAEAEDAFDPSKMFSLKKIGERQGKTFQFTEWKYEIKISNLTKDLDNFNAMVVLPKIFEEILKCCTDEFDPDDRICIELACQDLEPSIYLHVKHFKDFNIRLLLAQTEKLNSSKKFKIDDSFRIKIQRVKYVIGGKNGDRQNIHSTVDRKRCARSLVSVHVGNNLCLPAALYLGKYRITHDVAGEDKNRWKVLYAKPSVGRLERLVEQELQGCGLPIGEKFGLCDVATIQVIFKITNAV